MTVREYNPQADFDLIRRAYEYARKEHNGQLRKSGEPYIIHPIAVAQIIAGLKLDSESIAAALLHDVIEDTPATHEDVAQMFGETIADLVEGVSKLTRIQYDTVEDEQMENFRKMLMAMNQDIRVILIKICDRLHNMRTMDFQPPHKQRQKSLETMEIYVPISYRLGVRRVQAELEDLSLKYLDPVAYEEIMDEVQRQRNWYEGKMRRVAQQIHDYLTGENIDNEVSGRIKRPYSIYRKTIMQDRSIRDIFDLFAYRIIVNTVGDCYHVLGLIHDFYQPLPGHFKDYIGNPKRNGYQSLHTIVTTGNEHDSPFEVQIRTKEMHQVAEFGVAAHWKYKQDQNGVKTGAGDSHYDEGYRWVQQLLDNQDGAEPEDYIHSLKFDLFDDKVFVFTPKGEVRSLPAGATPIDFAYAIHSDVGNQMTGAAVNGKIVPLDYQLKNGDRVEVKRSKSSKGPSRNWLQIAKSNQARSKIRQWFRTEKRDENVINGRQALEEELKRYNLRLKDATTPEMREILLNNTAYRTLEDLYAAIGYGAFTAHKAAMRVENEYRRTEKQKRTEALQPEAPQAREPTAPAEPAPAEQGIVVGGLDNCLVKFARCCAPVPGDPIKGFITKGYGVSVHRADCPNASAERMAASPGRWVKVSWGAGLNESYPTAVEAVCRDRPKLMLDIASALADSIATARSFHIQSTDDGMALCRLEMRVPNKAEVDRLMRKVMQVSGVLQVTRPAK
ncbi:MAG: bifunctional (p)ppGpp synthetase/guanosine-3',5'-bis(diphosphate) 3'-pyrophosphohydrolase [Oscillibacter sp.]|nr:bifunctional (p)ppGpp synthetase/guanosine-3',5'-bis(diphosphate) 3'-pyrophosphohydrolase [Oscillibacter sp.]